MAGPADAPNLELDLDDLDPVSTSRPVDAFARRLALDTGLRGSDASLAWVTVTDAMGAVHYEGPPSAAGAVDISFHGTKAPERVCVFLETPRGHRQAEVTLGDRTTLYVFA